MEKTKKEAAKLRKAAKAAKNANPKSKTLKVIGGRNGSKLVKVDGKTRPGKCAWFTT